MTGVLRCRGMSTGSDPAMHRRTPHERGDVARPRLCRNGRATLAALAIPLMVCAGCVTTGPHSWLRNGLKVGPEYGRPPAPVAENWIQAGDPRVQNVQLENGDWWNL